MQPDPPVSSGFYERLSKTHPGTADLLKDLGQTAVKSATLPWLAKIQGEATKNFNDAAYPGTATIDQLGAGSAGPMMDAAKNSDEMRQREKESRRASSTALQTARIGAGERVAGLLLANNPQNAPQAIKILAATGGFPPEFGFDPKTLVNGKLEAELGVANAQTGKYKTEAQQNVVNTQLAPLETAIRQWSVEAGKSNIANELRGTWDLFKGWAADVYTATTDPEELETKMFEYILDKHGEGEAYGFKKTLDEVKEKMNSKKRQIDEDRAHSGGKPLKIDIYD